MSDTANPQTTPAEAVEVREIEVIRYAVECPTCSQWHEHDESKIRAPAFECICGTMIKAVQ